MKRVLILQARMTSTRLPGKVLMDVAGRPMLAQQLRRLTRCRNIDEIVVATTVNSTDDVVAEVARAEGARCFRGSEHDVLQRYVGAAEDADADVIVRVTADCPLIDPAETDRVVESLVAAPDGCDYASNVVRRTYPKGLDTEAMFMDTLRRVHRLAQSTVNREHVTSYIVENPDRFLIKSVEDFENNSNLRWTVDWPEDLELVRRIYDLVELNAAYRPYRNVLASVRANPELMALNAHLASV